MKRIFASYPRIDGQYGRVSTVKFVTCSLLLAALLFFGGGATRALSDIRQHNALLEQRTYELPWALMQLQLEMGRFLDALHLRYADAISLDELMLRYDILWSRTPILLSSQYQETFSDSPSLWLLIRQIDNRIRAVESMVEGLQPGSSQYLAIATELGPYLDPLARNISALMHENVRFYAEYDQAYRQLGKHIYQQIMGFFITLLLLLLLLFRELRRYWSLQQQDPLTGLPNRLALQRHMKPLIEQEQPFSVMVLELKDSDVHYQRFGFEVMDKLLQECSLRLQSTLLAHEYLAQPSPSGLVVLANGVVELSEVRAQISRFQQALSEKATVNGYDFYMEPLMGVVLYPADADNLVDLLARGDLALALCTQQQKPYVFFDPSLLKEMSRRQQLAKGLPAALSSNSLTLQLQPFMAWPTKECVGLQVLTSWHHPHFGVISPTELQRITEQYQCSESVMLWTLQSVCSQLKVWQRYSKAPVFVSLTVPCVLLRKGLGVMLMTVLQQFGIPASRLVLELNKDITKQDTQAVKAILHGIRAVGIRVILTEFGRGGGALSALSQLPLDWLKMDTAFCNSIEYEGETHRLLEVLFAMAEVLQHPLICSNVDHDNEWAELKSLGKPLLVQGNVLGEALFVTEVSEWLQQCNQATR